MNASQISSAFHPQAGSSALPDKANEAQASAHVAEADPMVSNKAACASARENEAGMKLKPPKHKVAIVTGGTRGIGLASARKLAEDGYNLILGYNSNAEAANLARRGLEDDFGVRVACVAGDVSKMATLDALFECVKREFNNNLTAYVHNAGLHRGVTSGDSKSASSGDFTDAYKYYQAVYTEAFTGAIHRAQSCNGFRHMVAISSPGCNALQRPVLVYEHPGQAKASMEYLVRHHAKAYGKKLTVNCVIPGLIRTQAWDKLFENRQWGSSEQLEQMATATPLGRWIEPEEIGDVVSFLCSPRANLFTGWTFPADGGMHLG